METQDLYPDFLRSVHGVLPKTVSYLAILYNVGAIFGRNRIWPSFGSPLAGERA